MSFDCNDNCNLTAVIERVELAEGGSNGDGLITQGLSTALAYAGSLVGQGQHAVYAIRVSKNGTETFVKKRFSDFAALHQQLVQAFPAGLAFDLPDKGIVRQFSDAALSDRKQALNAYLKALCRSERVVQHLAVQRFFECSASSALESVQADAQPYSEAPELSTSPPLPTMPDDPFEPIKTSAASRAPFQAQITCFDIKSGGSTAGGQGSLFPGLGALVQSAGNLIGQGQYAVYTIQVTCNGKVTSVQKRFSDFDALHTRLVTAFPAGVPFSLPEKTTVASLNNEFLRDRARALNDYVKALCNSGRPAKYAGVRTFFGLDNDDVCDSSNMQGYL